MRLWVGHGLPGREQQDPTPKCVEKSPGGGGGVFIVEFGATFSISPQLGRLVGRCPAVWIFSQCLWTCHSDRTWAASRAWLCMVELLDSARLGRDAPSMSVPSMSVPPGAMKPACFPDPIRPHDIPHTPLGFLHSSTRSLCDVSCVFY